MPKNSWNDYSTTAASNTDVHSVSIAEGMAPSDVNNAMRELMVDVANFDQGNVTLTSALAIASGGTGATSAAAARTALGITNAESAIAGVLQTNANFVDQVIFGPAVDGRPWNGLWNKASVFSSLMLATIEDEGSNTEINIWDLTEASGSAISTTPLATVDLASAATPTAIAASMGYLIVSSEDGIAIIDPHSGAWAERTVGWPRRLSTGTTPALGSNNVDDVAATIARMAPLDPRTGGPMPTFRISSDSTTNAILANDGVPHNAEVTSHKTAGWDGNTAIAWDANNSLRLASAMRLETKADNGDEEVYATGTTEGNHLIANETSNCLAAGPSGAGTMFADGQASGLNLIDQSIIVNGQTNGMIAHINRTYNTGYMHGKIRGAWLANSNTADRSWKGNTLTNNGTVPTGATESGAELQFYGPFSTSNYLSRASDADWDVLGTGAVYMSCWVKSASCAASEAIMGFSNSGGTIRCTMTWATTSGDFTWELQGASATVSTQSNNTGYDDDAWHKVDLVQVSSTERYMYVDGVLADDINTTDCGSLSSSGNLPFAIGRLGGSSGQGATTTKAALARLSATAPTATQVRQMYDAEKGMFVASAECLLQSSSTDAVLDVDVDPLTGKVLVTQTDAITVFDGLVVDSKPTVNSGSSEKGKLWGNLRTEQNSANAYVTAPAVDQRQVNEMVRGLAAGLPAGVDLSKAKAWLHLDGTGTIAIKSSYNIASVTDVGTGSYRVKLAVPFKSTTGFAAFGSLGITFAGTCQIASPIGHAAPQEFTVYTVSHADAFTDNDDVYLAFYRELENE